MPTFVRTQEITHPIGQTGRFSLRVSSHDVELRATDSDTATVRIHFELRAESDEEADDLFRRIQYDVAATPNSLEVTEPRSGSGGLAQIARMLGIGSAKMDVAIEADIPAGAEISYEGVSGDLSAFGLTGTQSYRTVSGDLVLDRVAGTLRVRAVSGDVSLRSDEPIRTEMNTVSGDVSAISPRFESLRLVTVSGDVELEGGLGSESPHRVETVSGDLMLGVVGGLALEVRGLSTDTSIGLPHRAEGSRDRRRYVVGGGEAQLQFSSMSGDVAVRASRRFSGPTPPTSPTPPTPPTPPTAPVPPTPPTPPTPPRKPVSEDEQLAILRALEAGEIDIDEAGRRLAGERNDA